MGWFVGFVNHGVANSLPTFAVCVAAVAAWAATFNLGGTW